VLTPKRSAPSLAYGRAAPSGPGKQREVPNNGDFTWGCYVQTAAEGTMRYGQAHAYGLYVAPDADAGISSATYLATDDSDCFTLGQKLFIDFLSGIYVPILFPWV